MGSVSRTMAASHPGRVFTGGPHCTSLHICSCFGVCHHVFDSRHDHMCFEPSFPCTIGDPGTISVISALSQQRKPEDFIFWGSKGGWLLVEVVAVMSLHIGLSGGSTVSMTNDRESLGIMSQMVGWSLDEFNTLLSLLSLFCQVS